MFESHQKKPAISPVNLCLAVCDVLKKDGVCHRNVYSILCHEPVSFSSSLLKREPTWLQPKEFIFKQKCPSVAWKLVELPYKTCRWTFLHIFSTLIEPLNKTCRWIFLHIFYVLIEPPYKACS